MVDIETIFQSNNGNTEKIVTIKPFELLKTNLDLKTFIENYNFSRFGMNTSTFKRLIKKIFNEKLFVQFNWNNKIFENSKLILLNCNFLIQNSEELIQLKSTLEEKSLKKYKGTLISSNRLIDIEKLVNKINKNIELPPPLFISGKVLNQLGGEINNNEMFVIDGSRRILANTLCKNTILIWLII